MRKRARISLLMRGAQPEQVPVRAGNGAGSRDTGDPSPPTRAFSTRPKEEHFDYTEYADFDDAYRQIEHWIEVEYITERIHSALGYLTPAESEAAFHSRVGLLISA